MLKYQRFEYIKFINLIIISGINKLKNIKLSTPINIGKGSRIFSYDSVISGIGSCFAQYIMEYFQSLDFNTKYNPNGIVYNAVSIAKSLDHVVNEKIYDPKCFINHNSLWHSWEHHGSFSNSNLNRLKSKINKTRTEFKKKLADSDLFILTPSSSVVYCLESEGIITANCHKYPGKNFKTKVLRTEANFAALSDCISSIREVNKHCLIVITLSPVRHYPGNLILNAKSKANLLSAIHQCIDKFENTEYFPAYEILLDELRDYRFYNVDMLHPTDLAREIIINRFISTYFSPDCITAINKKKKQLKASQHRTNNSIF